MDLREAGCEAGRWMKLAQDRVQWRALVLAVLELQAPLAESYLLSRVGSSCVGYLTTHLFALLRTLLSPFSSGPDVSPWQVELPPPPMRVARWKVHHPSGCVSGNDEAAAHFLPSVGSWKEPWAVQVLPTCLLQNKPVRVTSMRAAHDKRSVSTPLVLFHLWLFWAYSEQIGLELTS
jgi:hypothetical protein